MKYGITYIGYQNQLLFFFMEFHLSHLGHNLSHLTPIIFRFLTIFVNL